jgi:HSP20 family molecular chaperone IbpA
LVKRTSQRSPPGVFLPNTDIFETKNALTVVMEMPDREHIDITVEDSFSAW